MNTENPTNDNSLAHALIAWCKDPLHLIWVGVAALFMWVLIPPIYTDLFAGWAEGGFEHALDDIAKQSDRHAQLIAVYRDCAGTKANHAKREGCLLLVNQSGQLHYLTVTRDVIDGVYAIETNPDFNDRYLR